MGLDIQTLQNSGPKLRFTWTPGTTTNVSIQATNNAARYSTWPKEEWGRMHIEMVEGSEIKMLQVRGKVLYIG